jgi:hypothetical protein
MAEISKFFNSAPGDPRTYQAGDFADYFGSVLSTGLLHTDNIPALEVKCDGNDLRTYVTPGKAIIQGYLYENTSNLYLNHALPEPTLDRIDRIVLRLDKRNQSRYIKLFVKQGTPSENPVPPELQRDDFIYELSLAQIRVRANTSTLNPADLIDERLDENLCGLVHSLISIPTSQFQAQWDLYFNAKKDEIDAETLNYLQQLASNIASFEQEWDTWFSGIQNEGFASAEEFNAHLADYVKHPAFAVTTGSANAYEVTLNPAPTAYEDGFGIVVAIHADSTGAATLNVNGLGAIPIKKANGNNVTNLKANGVYTLRYSAGNFILQGEGGYGNAQPSDVLSGKTFTNDSGEQTGTMANHGAYNIMPGTSNIIIPAGYHNGSGVVYGDADLIAENIKQGVDIFGVMGTLIPRFTLTKKQTISGGFSYYVTPQGQAQGWRYNTHNANFAPKLIVLTFNYNQGSAGGISTHPALAFWISPEVLGVDGTTVTVNDLYRSASGNGPDAWNGSTQFYPITITNVVGNSFQIGQASYKTDWTYYRSYFADQSYTVTVYG